MRLHHQHGSQPNLRHGTEVEIVECEAQADGRYHLQVNIKPSRVMYSCVATFVADVDCWTSPVSNRGAMDRG
jgi:hypothetical protein